METEYNGITIVLSTDAEHTSRLMPYLPYHEVKNGGAYWFEMSAEGHDKNGNSCTVYWEFKTVKGSAQELDTYDYSKATRVIWD